MQIGRLNSVLKNDANCGENEADKRRVCVCVCVCEMGEGLCPFKSGGHRRPPGKVTSDDVKEVRQPALQTSGKGIAGKAHSTCKCLEVRIQTRQGWSCCHRDWGQRARQDREAGA